jgi:hypothetical protein
MAAPGKQKPFWTQMNADLQDLLGSGLLLAKKSLTPAPSSGATGQAESAGYTEKRKEQCPEKNL